MLPEQRKIIGENQQILYSFRNNGRNLPEKELVQLAKKIGNAYKTMQKSLYNMSKNNIILDCKKFLVNPNFAYFAGFYVTDNEVEIEVLDFSLEPVLEKNMPGFKKKFQYEELHELIGIIENVIDDISKNIKIESIAIIFDKFINYQTSIAYYENGLDFKIYNLSVHIKSSRGLWTSSFRDVFVGDIVLANTLYSREKVFESNSIVYYDLDLNSVCYIMNGILQKNTNPVTGMVFPRFTTQQKKMFRELENVSDSTYVSSLKSNIHQLDSIIEEYLQLKALFNPEHFILGGKWLRKGKIEDIISYSINEKICKNNESPQKILMLEGFIPFFEIINKDEQSAKGAGIFAAYSFFNWDFKW